MLHFPVSATSPTGRLANGAVAAVITALPDALDLLCSGALTTDHLAALGSVVDKPGAERLLHFAVGMSPDDFSRTVQQFRLSLEHSEDVAARQHAARSLRFSNGPDGMVHLSGLLPSLQGATLATILGAISEANYRRAHPDRAHVLGGHATDTRDQRLADALLELTGIASSTMATEVGDASTQSDAATRSAMVNHDRYESVWPGNNASSDVDTAHPAINERGKRAPIRITTAKPATVIVFNVDRFQAEMLNHGPIPTTASLFDHVKRDLHFCFENNAVWVRDLRCQYPGCDATAATSQIHHINEWLADLGITDVEVLILLCHAHHQHLHTNQLIGSREADGSVSIRVRTTGERIAIATPIRPSFLVKHNRRGRGPQRESATGKYILQVRPTRPGIGFSSCWRK